MPGSNKENEIQKTHSEKNVLCKCYKSPVVQAFWHYQTAGYNFAACCKLNIQLHCATPKKQVSLKKIRQSTRDKSELTCLWSCSYAVTGSDINKSWIPNKKFILTTYNETSAWQLSEKALAKTSSVHECPCRSFWPRHGLLNLLLSLRS